MSSPAFANSGGSYRLTWDTPELLTIEFERLDVTRREFTAEIRVTSTAPGASGLLYQARVNLDSDMAREKLAARLAKRAPGTGLDFDGLVQQACLKVLDAYRTGDPPVLLGEVAQPPGAGFLLHPLALTRHHVIVFGDGGTLKSYFLLAAGIDIHSGSRLLGLENGARLRVGYIDAEFDGWEHRSRAVRLVGESVPGLVYIRSVGPLRDQVERLQRIVRDQELGFLLVDSVGFMCDGPPEEAASALGFFDALRQLGVGSLCAAHSNRLGDTEKPFGSVFWHNSARSTWYVKKQQEVGGDQVTIGLFNKKSNVDRLAPPLGYTFTFGQDRTIITRADVRDVPELAGQVPLKSRIERLMGSAAKPWTYLELASELGSNVEAVSKAIRRGEGKQFTRVSSPDGVHHFGLLARQEIS